MSEDHQPYWREGNSPAERLHKVEAELKAALLQLSEANALNERLAQVEPASIRVLNAKLEETNRLNGVMRLLLENADMAWAQGWDCSASPGHKGMHHVMPMISEFLNKTEKRKCECPHHEKSPALAGCRCCGQSVGQ